MRTSSATLLFLLFYCYFGTYVSAEKILMIPLPFSSMVAMQQTLGNALINQGHEITMVLPISLPGLEKFSSGRIKVLTHEIYGQDFYNMEHDGDWSDDFMGKSFTHIYRYMFDPVVSYCMDVLKDNKLMTTLKGAKYDFAIIDSNIGVRLYYLVPYVLGIPYVSLNCERDSWALRNPDLPSHVPFVLGGSYTNEMTFWQRLDNTYKMVEWAIKPNVWYNEDNVAQSLVPDVPYSVDELYRKSLLFFIDCEMIIDYPRALQPNEIILGGLTIKKPKPLPTDIANIMNNAKHGVILMSFGSSYPDKNSEVFFEVFSKLPQTVIWRFFGTAPDKVPDNVKLFQWLPQHDILAHNNTKLFITHCGTMGQHESVYYGVPMVGFPFSADQMYNSKRMVHHNFGIALNIRTITTTELRAAITEVLGKEKYTAKVQKASKILQDRPTLPIERAVWWIEHVMKFGGDHLRSKSQDMPSYQFLMLDIFAFVVVCLFVLVVLLVITLKCLMRLCKQQTSKGKTD